MRLVSFVVVVSFWTLFNQQPAQAESFDCHNANIVTEKIICGSKELSNLDLQLSQLYKREFNKTYVDTDTLVHEQREWLNKRNKCEYSFDCLKTLITRRIAEFDPISTTTQAYSWGGKLRAEPNLTSKQVGSTTQRQEIIVLQKTSEVMNGFTWFLIETKGVTAYQWGGILCAPGVSGSFCSN